MQPIEIVALGSSLVSDAHLGPPTCLCCSFSFLSLNWKKKRRVGEEEAMWRGREASVDPWRVKETEAWEQGWL